MNSNDGSSILAFGGGPRVSAQNENCLNTLQTFIKAHQGDYLFGYLSYDLKNEVESLTSSSVDHKAFPNLFFWCPKIVVKIENEKRTYLKGNPSKEHNEVIDGFFDEQPSSSDNPPIELKPLMSESEYVEAVNSILHHLQMGDIYELNFCQEFLAENVDIPNPKAFYKTINHITNAPFSCYLQFDEFNLFCGSPERFLQKRGTQLVAQPIKGTAPRGITPEEDDRLKSALRNDPKEQSENVMIVDLMRNDLSKVAKKNSVTVPELFGIYSFDTVHQMISTVACELKDGTGFLDIIHATFPMGSMTGAPKIRAMELIEQYENFKRGIYSGCVGYIAPNGDFDFNVVIRSMFYNGHNRKLTCDVGSAITIQSNPQKEYQECFTKIERLMNGINGLA